MRRPVHKVRICVLGALDAVPARLRRKRERDLRSTSKETLELGEDSRIELLIIVVRSSLIGA